MRYEVRPRRGEVDEVYDLSLGVRRCFTVRKTMLLLKKHNLQKGFLYPLFIDKNGGEWYNIK